MDPFSTIKGAQIPAEQVKVFVGQTTQSKGHLVSTSQHIIKMMMMIMMIMMMMMTMMMMRMMRMMRMMVMMMMMVVQWWQQEGGFPLTGNNYFPR